MHTAQGKVVELILENGLRHARIFCPSNLIPAPGQYLMASHASDLPLPVPLFYTDSSPQGFVACAPMPDAWAPGMELSLRGPLGRGFILPAASRKVALIAFDDAPSRLRGLITPALKQRAAVVLVTDFESSAYPDDVEVQPLSALDEVVAWSDYAAFDVMRENLPELRVRLERMKKNWLGKDAQVIIRTPIPCGGIAECGVCSVILKSGPQMACLDGPVFALKEI